jgi:hypothetical protein
MVIFNETSLVNENIFNGLVGKSNLFKVKISGNTKSKKPFFTDQKKFTILSYQQVFHRVF